MLNCAELVNEVQRFELVCRGHRLPQLIARLTWDFKVLISGLGPMLRVSLSPIIPNLIGCVGTGPTPYIPRTRRAVCEWQGLETLLSSAGNTFELRPVAGGLALSFTASSLATTDQDDVVHHSTYTGSFLHFILIGVQCQPLAKTPTLCATPVCVC